MEHRLSGEGEGGWEGYNNMHVHVHVKLMLAFVILRVYTCLGENFARLGAYNIIIILLSLTFTIYTLTITLKFLHT